MGYTMFLSAQGPLGGVEARDPEKPGEFTWAELMTTDHEAAHESARG